MDEIRLQKYLAKCGVASRRKAEELMLNGNVTVNGKKADQLGIKINDSDIVKVNGKAVKLVNKKIYIMLNKPTGVVTTAKDTHNRKTVIDLVKKEIKERVFPVGRLDKDTQGLLLLTNDGDLTYTLTHPKHVVDKTYIVSIDSSINNSQIKALTKGVLIDDFLTSPAKVRVINDYGSKSEIEIIIHEGRNRQVRRMFEAVSCNVIALERISIGNIKLGHLPLGRWRHLSKGEVDYLLKLKEKI